MTHEKNRVQPGEELERELADRLEADRFDPPEKFSASAQDAAESLHQEAALDPVSDWERQAKDLHWFERWDEALDDSDPPFYKWFAGGRLNAS